ARTPRSSQRGRRRAAPASATPAASCCGAAPAPCRSSRASTRATATTFQTPSVPGRCRQSWARRSDPSGGARPRREMTVRLEAVRAQPEFPWLDGGDLPGVRAFLAARGWLESGETVLGCARAGEGNMNLTLRLRTDRRSVVLKQARPWVEKYDHIEAPWERSLSERWFYERVATIPGVVGWVPRLLASDESARALLLDDLRDASDLTGLYAGGRLEPEEGDRLARVLRARHDGTAGRPRRAPLHRPER